MSEALKYLMQLKPEAMGNYFSFIKQSGQQLDEKTRAIISIITKVDNQTEKGLRQYTRRGLDLGLTPIEIIDALFVAFPSLGLTKIVWAVDIFLDMDIPGFDLEQIQAERSWHELLPLKNIKEGVNFCSSSEGKNLIVLSRAGTFKVYDRRCPHQSGQLPEECNDDLQIRCPVHQWLFSLTDGSCVEGGDRPLIQYKNKIENNSLHVLW